MSALFSAAKVAANPIGGPIKQTDGIMNALTGEDKKRKVAASAAASTLTTPSTAAIGTQPRATLSGV